MNNFNFIGKLVISHPEKFCEITDKGQKMNFGIRHKNDTAYLTLFDFGLPEKEIQSRTDDNEAFSIKVEDRFNPTIIQQTAKWTRYCTNVGSNDGKQIEFIHSTDFFNHLATHLPKLDSDAVLKVSGRIRFTVANNGNIYTNFEPKRIYVVSESSISKEEQGLFLNLDIYYKSEDVDTSNAINSTVIKAYVKEYISSKKENRYIPQTFYFDNVFKTSKNNGATALEACLSYLKVDDIPTMIKSAWRCKYRNGAEEEVINNDEIPLEIRAFERLGNAYEQHRVLGKHITRIVLLKPINLPEGRDKKERVLSILTDTGESFEDFSKLIYDPQEVKQIQKEIFGVAEIENTVKKDIEEKTTEQITANPFLAMDEELNKTQNKDVEEELSYDDFFVE